MPVDAGDCSVLTVICPPLVDVEDADDLGERRLEVENREKLEKLSDR